MYIYIYIYTTVSTFLHTQGRGDDEMMIILLRGDDGERHVYVATLWGRDGQNCTYRFGEGLIVSATCRGVEHLLV